MLLEHLNPLPVRVRPAQYESLDSYEQRLRAANLYPKRAWNTFINAALRADKALERATAVECLGNVRAGHFAGAPNHFGHADGTTCDRCATGLQERYACARCHPGLEAKQVPHDGPRVCRRHMRWVGPGTTPGEQFSVGPEALRADREYRRMRRHGLADAHSLAETLACVDAWANLNASPIDPAKRFVVAVDMLRILHGATRIALADADSATRYSALAAAIEAAVAGENRNVLVDAIWLLVRSARHQPTGGAHTIPCAFVALAAEDGGAELRELTTSFYPRVRHLQLTQLVQSPAAGTRFDVAKRVSDENEYVCPKGHPFGSTGSVLKASKASGGCRYCARKKAAPGTSLADTHPDLAREWHPTKNGVVTPADVLSGTGVEYFWLCPEKGHAYEASPNARTNKNSGCGYCANLLVDETNSLRTTHPHLVPQWNSERNWPLTPDNVVAGSEQEVFWVCPEGHDFPAAVASRTGGSGCLVCTHQLVHPTTCLAATHPEVAAKWDYERNGDLTPEMVFAGTSDKVWWICDEGCSYDAAITSKVRGVGCRYCSNRGVNERNSMRATHPHLAAQMHPTKNGKRTPDNVVAGTRHSIQWLCEKGHDWPATGDNRVHQDAGCPYCNNRKVWPGFNDMASCRPDLAAEFDRDNNGDLTPETIVVDTWRPLHWKCADGHTWRATGESRAVKGRGCRRCATSASTAA